MSPPGSGEGAAAEAGPRLVVGSSNPGKVREISALLAGLPVRVCALSECGPVELPEEGDDYAANAAAKARAVAAQTGSLAVADDSGLEVDALGGRPGPRSARYGGPDLDDAGRVARLLEEIGDRPEAERGARFVCHASLATPDGRVETAVGVCSGRILAAPRGEGGFGYDPVFVPEGYACSMAELSADEKDRISHRGRALERLAPAIRAALGPGGGA